MVYNPDFIILLIKSRNIYGVSITEMCLPQALLIKSFKHILNNGTCGEIERCWARSHVSKFIIDHMRAAWIRE